METPTTIAPTQAAILEGYQRTEVGVIPEDWEVVTLKDAAVFLDGNRKPVKKSKRDNMDGQYPYYGASGIIDYVNDYLFDDEFILLAEDGENILSRSSRIAFQINGKAWVNNHAHVLKPYHDFNITYLTEYLESLNYEEYNSGTAQPKLNKKTCENIAVLKPSLEEQRAIAEALSDVDALITELDALIEKKQQVKKGAMQQLLTGKKRLPGFDGEWEEKKLGDVLTVMHGKSQKAVASGNGKYPILGTSGQIGKANKYLYDKPSVLIGRKGTIDRPQYMDEPFWTIDTLFYTHVNEKAIAKYLYYRFLLIDWTSYNEASGVPSLNSSTIENIEILFPKSIEEQKAIGQILSDMDAEIQSLRAKRDKYEQIKQGMMQELLTGKIRLIERN